MKLYHTLSSFKFLSKSYASKFIFVAFIGINLPLIGIILYVGVSGVSGISPLMYLIVTLLLSLAAFALTWMALKKLLQPVGLAKDALDRYLKDREIPELPSEYTDEMGMLLFSIGQTINSLEDANKAKADLIYTITHDLRSPLTQIVSLTNSLESASPEERLKLGKRIQKSAEEELDFIANYLAMVETGDFTDQKTSRVRANLLELVQRVAAKVDFQLLEKKLLLQLDIPAAIKITTPNPVIFERVIQNLMSNAIKFSHYNNAIRIQAKEDNGKVKITIADNGVGFNPEIADELFLKFTPHKRPGTMNESTNGIGLYLTTEIVNIHNGKIWATSNGPDTGAQFHIELPM